MKTLRVIMVLLVLCVTSKAQVISKVVVKPNASKSAKAANTTVKSEDETKMVIDSIKKEFPEPVVNLLTAIPAKTYGKEWNVYISKESEEETPSYYEVEIKAANGYQTAVYDKAGNLLRVKQIIKNAELPEAVKNTINTKYNDWQVIGDEERISNAAKFTVDYKIKLKKGILRKTVFINPKGEIKNEFPF
ncbi:MAG: hypothetical protein JWN56_617 [Sphingobacteriales bacterium]|nr:hypothetical protein [Sphingobacteriales bacterium]